MAGKLDGKRIAFLSNRDGGQTQVYVADADGGIDRVVSHCSLLRDGSPCRWDLGSTPGSIGLTPGVECVTMTVTLLGSNTP